MIYLMSDIHGDYKHFNKLLEIIKFQDKDKIYILGDVINKNGDNIKMLDYCMKHNNIILLKGNHERWLQKIVEEPNYISTFIEKCSGKKTYEEWISLSDEMRDKYYNYICQLPYYQVVTINQKKYMLTHTGYMKKCKPVYESTSVINIEKTIEKMVEEDEYQYLCYSDIFELPKDVQFNIFCFVGHVPTLLFEEVKNSEIMWRKNFANIDCSAGWRKKGGKLSCIRLDDMNTWYS